MYTQGMNTFQIFATQVAISTLAWGLVAWAFVIPLVKKWRCEDALALLLVPQLFRHIGMTLLAPGITAAALPPEFTQSVAYGDLVTAVLAALAFVSLKLKWTTARRLVWVASIFGFGDLIHNVYLGMSLEVAPLLHAGWVIPTFVVPLMTWSHLLTFWRLLSKSRN